MENNLIPRGDLPDRWAVGTIHDLARNPDRYIDVELRLQRHSSVVPYRISVRVHESVLRNTEDLRALLNDLIDTRAGEFYR